MGLGKKLTIEIPDALVGKAVSANDHLKVEKWSQKVTLNKNNLCRTG